MPDQNNNTAVVAYRYYPKLSSVVSTEDIPDILGFIKDGIDSLFENIHYKDLQYNKSPRGDAAFYSLSIVSKRLDIELPGTGIYLVLNPDADATNISAFPITVEYEWKILAYLRDFNLANFSFAPQEFFEIALRVLNISEEQAIANFINTFTEPVNDSITSLEQFVTDINDANSYVNLLTPTQETTLVDVVSEIYNQSQKYATLIGFATYISKNDLEDTKVKLKEFFRSLLPQDIEEYIKDIIIPKFRATLTLSAGIEFPRNILKPVYDEYGNYPNGVDENGLPLVLTGEALTELPVDSEGGPKVLLTFEEALFYADTEEGFGYNLDLVLNTNYPAQIGNTGLIVDIQNLKIDLSKTTNITEADLDNRPPEFMGVYMERTDIFLPKKWFKKETEQTLAISGEKLLIGTGGMSGTIALRATSAVDAAGQVTDYFSNYFNIDYSSSVIVTSNGIEENITDQSNLLAHINELKSPYLLKFKYPLTITTSTETLTFDNEINYNNFIGNIDPNQFMWFQLGSNTDKAWRLGFNRFDLTFHHGQVVESNLKARIEIPKFKDLTNPDDDTAIVDLEGHWYSAEDFSLTASFLQDPRRLSLFNFINIDFLSVEIGKDDDRFFLGTACEIGFENSIMKKILGDQKIQLPNLRIYENGSMEIVGGNAFIPTNISLNLGPIDMAVTGIHFGSYQQEDNQDRMRKYNYWGFDGAISLDPLGIDARGEGVKYYYTVDNDELDTDGNLKYSGGDNFLRIQTIEVDLVIPGSASPGAALAIIHGMLSIPEPGESQEYVGEVSLKLPKAKIAGGAAMKLQPKYPAFVVDAHIDLPAPIPIGPLGIYGFRGLLGFRYVAEKEAVGLKSGEDTWYDYYTHPPKGVHVSKFSGPERTEGYDVPISLGAGAVLGTSFDSGTVISVRAMLLLSLPTLFLVEGKASILSARLGLDDNREPPFFAFVAWGDNSIEMGMGADFQLPQDNGAIIDLQAKAEAGFFFNGQKNWYVNFGTKENPVTAKVLTIVTAQSYLSLSARGIEVGARVEFNLKKRFGPAKVHIYAYLEIGGFVSFERPQIGGYLALGGMVDIDIWIVGVTIGLDAIFSVEAPKPFLIYAEIKLKVCIKIFWKKICKSFTIKIKLGKESNIIDVSPIPALPYEGDTDRTKELVQGMHMLTNESFELDFINVDNAGDFIVNPNIEITKTIPLDTYIDIKTAKGLNPIAVSTIIGGHTGGADNFIDLVPPQKVIRGGREIRQVKHKYSIEDIEIKALSSFNEWVEYHPFEALVKLEDRGKVNNLRIGYWQRAGNQYDAIRLLATNPFSYTEAGEPGWLIPEEYGVTPSELFCKSEEIVHDCANFLNKELGTTYFPPTQYIGHYINGAYFTLEEGFETSVNINKDGTQDVTVSDDNFRIKETPNDLEFDRFSDFDKSLEFDNGNHLIIILPEPSVEISLQLTTYGEGVTIRYYKSTGIENNNAVYVEIDNEYKTASELSEEIIYNPEEPTDSPEEQILVSKIVIETKNRINGGIGFMQIQSSESQNEKGFEVGKQVDRIVGSKYYTTSLQEVCWMTVENEEYNLTIPGEEAVEKEQEDMVAAVQKTIQPIWRPNTKYYIRFRLKDEVDNGNSAEGIFDYYYGFKTAGPLGHYHKDSNVDYLPTGANPDQYPLTSLRQYIDYDRSYPNADGSLLQAKPIFYGNNQCKIAIYFSKPLTYHMLSKWEAYNGLPELTGNMHITIKDPVTNVVIPYPLPTDFERELIPNGETFATFLEIDWVDVLLPLDDQEVEVPVKLNILDKVDQSLGEYKVIFSNLINRQHIRIDDEAILFDNQNIIGGKIQFEVNGANIEYTILEIGKEEEATWLKVDWTEVQLTNNEKVEVPIELNIIDKNGQSLEGYTVLFSKLMNRQHIRVDDEAILSDNQDLIGGKIQGEVNGTNIEQTILSIGKEEATWNIDNDPRIPANLQILNKMVEHINENDDAIKCDLKIGKAIVPNSYSFNTTLTNLKPSKLYTAQVYNAFDKESPSSLENAKSEEVHQFVFQTSKYDNFKEQVESYWLQELDTNNNVIEQRQAVFEIPLNLSELEITTAYNIVAGNNDVNSDNLESQYYHLFDRATAGVLKFVPLDPPTNTEFNILKNSTTDKTIGILIRNPEPFNIPKIPLEDIEGSIAVVNASGSIDVDYKVLYSKDYSQALIMHSSNEITVEILNFRFIYKVWNGSKYVESSDVLVENILIKKEN
ncbi:hypothetical protein [Polaribacter sp. L3A8]|uniref:hypothetical protein n=1 Tax=Polaribacter sp. L3A8 TaxID=2686361 RepID=UPI00131C9DC2|nr:hypothetical protein [Polaribacter sp. L3A8]